MGRDQETPDRSMTVPEAPALLDEARSEIRAFLIADVRGYTTFTQEHGDEAAARLAARFSGIVREEVERRGGALVELRGDEAVVMFGSPRQAIRVASELQDRFLRETSASPELPLPVGVGLDAGEAVAVEGGYRGGALNTAARLCSAAEAGEILASESLVHLARSVEGIDYLDRGQRSLKGLPDPIHVLAVASQTTDVVAEMRRVVGQGRPRPTYRGALRFSVLGPLEASAGADQIPLGGPKQRAVLAHLLIRPNQLVPAEVLIDELWGDEPPETARNTLQTYVSHLRKALGDRRIVGKAPGYVLAVEPAELDGERFDDLVREATKTSSVDPKMAVGLFDDALALWRGPAFADVAIGSSLVAEAARLDDLRLVAQEDRIEALLASGQVNRAVGEAEALLVRHPLRERLWTQLMVALYREGRQADALGAFQRARETLAEELGIDPSPEVVRLHERILRQDPALDLRGEPLRGYRLMEKIGEGPTGVVFRGIQPRVGRDVAVKVVHDRLAADGVFIRRFEPEAQAVVSLEHPHIAAVYDYWRDPQGACIVSRYFRGGSLRALEERGEDLAPERRTSVVQQIASALGFAHRQGVAHGAVRPSNVVLDAEGNAYLCDFHIAAGPPATVEDDLEQLAALGARLLEEGSSEAAIVHRLGVAEDRIGAAELADALSAPVGPEAMRSARRTVDVRNPYKGLRPFGEADAVDFFGRAQLVTRLVGRLNEPTSAARFLAVVGPSGSGKSSFVRAGLVPTIRLGALTGANDALVAELFPGTHPLEELESALLRVAARPIPGITDRLAAGSRGLLEVATDVTGDESELVLVVDQFEEIFTLTDDGAERELFLESLRVATADPASRVRVIVTLRADFFDRPLAYPRFGELLGARTEAVPPLSPDELEQAIRGPAEAVGVHPDPGLVAEMIADVASEPGALPLLQYALLELFERREDDHLTLDAYTAIGGVAGALSARAERLYGSSPPEEQRAIRLILLRLVSLGEGREDTRRRVTRSKLDALDVPPETIDSILEAFGRHRLLTFDREPITREPTVEIAHEALLGSWTRLRRWIDEARDDLRIERQVSRSASEWRAAGEDASFLLTGTRLAQIEAWVGSTDIGVGAEDRAFVRASVERRERDESEEHERREREARIERRSRSRLRALVGVLAAAAVVASGLSVIAVDQRQRAAREARTATARELASAAVANIDVDPERSVLLALEAVRITQGDGDVLPEAEEALHLAVQSDRLVRTLGDPSSANVDWSPDGHLIATGGTSGGAGANDVLLWDAASGRLVHRLRGHAGDISTVAFDGHGSRLVTTAKDNRVIVWDVDAGKRVRTIHGLGDQTVGAVFSPDGQRLVFDETRDAGTARVRVIDLRSGLDEFPSEWVRRGFCIPAFSPDGERIALGCGDFGTIIDARTGEERVPLANDDSVGVVIAFSPDGARLVGNGESEPVEWDARTGEQLHTFDGHVGAVQGVAFSPDSSRVATGGVDGTARVWDADSGEELLVLHAHRGLVALVDFSPDGTQLVTGGGDRTARIWDVTPTGGSEWRSVGGLLPGLRRVRYSPDGALMLLAGDRAWVVRSSTGERIRTFDTRDGFDTAISPGWDAFAMTAVDVLYVYTIGGSLLRTINTDGIANRIAFSPDGRVIAVATGGTPDPARVLLYDVSTGDRVGAFGEPIFPDWTFAVAFNPKGNLIAALNSLGGLTVWEVASGEEVLDVQGTSGNSMDVTFSPDGRLVVTAGGDGAAIWHVAAGERLHTIAGGGLVQAVAFSPDGSTLATGAADGSVRLWEADTGRELITLVEQGEVVTDLAISPDGDRLAVTTEDGTLRVFALRIRDLMRLARARLSRGFTDQECDQFLHLTTCPT